MMILLEKYSVVLFGSKLFEDLWCGVAGEGSFVSSCGG